MPQPGDFLYTQEYYLYWVEPNTKNDPEFQKLQINTQNAILDMKREMINEASSVTPRTNQNAIIKMNKISKNILNFDPPWVFI